MKDVSGNWDLGPDFTTGPEGQDRSLLAHCLTLVRNERTFDGYSSNPPWAVEFGVGEGHSLRMIARVMPVIGFDSFQGLPEDWRPGFPKGVFGHATNPADTENLPGVTIVPGWFETTVPDYEWPDSLALVHFDADLYSSTKTALDSIGGSLTSGCILVFDEFYGYEGCEAHEQRAFAEFVSDSGMSYDVVGHGREQWAVRVR